ncbi:unnamed protein product [Closterium sp. Yama58-4]|nr:unnamed protein product [Closterium sp. Yama58-4]
MTDAKDGVSLFDHASCTSVALADTAAALDRSQWQTRDAVTRLAIRNHLPITERAHFSQHKTAKALDHFLAEDHTTLTVDDFEQELLAADKSILVVGTARGTPRTPLFEGCSPSPLAPSYASSAAAVDFLGAAREVGVVEVGVQEAVVGAAVEAEVAGVVVGVEVVGEVAVVPGAVEVAAAVVGEAVVMEAVEGAPVVAMDSSSSSSRSSSSSSSSVSTRPPR